MSERFLSNGNEAKVYMDGNSHVVRIESQLVERVAITKFVNLKIASLLFPENFIDVQDIKLVRTQTKPRVYNFYEVILVDSYIKSKLAPTHPDHPFFSAHQKTYEEVTECTCDLCKAHRRLHYSTEYMHQLSDLKIKLNAAGILVPDDDHTDHCIGPNGIIFFEADLPETPKLREYLKHLGKNEVTEKINALLSYQHMMFSGCSPSESFRITKKVYPDVDLVDYSLNSSSVADSF